MAYKYKIKEEEGHSKYYPGGKTPGLTTSVMNQILKKIADSGDEDKKVKNKLKENYLSGKSFITSKLENYPKALSKVNQLIDMVGEVNFTMDIAKWVYDFFNNASFESPVNEAQSNPTDIISVDVPLFIRLLDAGALKVFKCLASSQSTPVAIAGTGTASFSDGISTSSR
jgi:hypothetical protein